VRILFRDKWEEWHPQQAFDAYYDDLALDVKRIGCLP